jgi:predicted nucleic acid-binding protein
MSYLLDMDIISAFHKKTILLKMASWPGKNEGDSFISVVSIAEMWRVPDPAPESHREELTRRIEVTEERFTEIFVPPDVDVLVRWKQLLAELIRVNRMLTCEDSLPSAACLANDFVLATNNVRHFEPARQFGLTIKNPLA